MHASRPPDIRIIHKLSNLMDTLGEIMNNRYQIEYRLGNAPIILMGRLSLAHQKGVPPKRLLKIRKGRKDGIGVGPWEYSRGDGWVISFWIDGGVAR